MTNAFISSLPLLSQQGRTTSTSAICTFDGLRKVDHRVATSTFIPSHQSADDTVAAAVDADMMAPLTMRCRRDLKKEKRVRNLEFARAHRKRTMKSFGNRRSIQEANASADNEFLSSIFGTIRFRGDGEEGNDDNKSGGSGGGPGGPGGPGGNKGSYNRKKQ